MTSAPSRETQSVGRRLRRPTGRTLFFAVLLVVVAIYTQMAFDLLWVTTAGRIGPGFFPRVIGILSLVIVLWGLVRSMLPGAVDDEDDPIGGDEEAGQADLGRHPIALLAVLGAAVVFLLIFFIPLGAIVSCALFLLAVLFLLNRRQPLVNVAIAVVLPVLVYLLFQTALNAGLPAGVLPRF